jgi:hypothetical protein
MPHFSRALHEHVAALSIEHAPPHRNRKERKITLQAQCALQRKVEEAATGATPLHARLRSPHSPARLGSAARACLDTADPGSVEISRSYVHVFPGRHGMHIGHIRTRCTGWPGHGRCMCLRDSMQHTVMYSASKAPPCTLSLCSAEVPTTTCVNGLIL